MGHRDDTVSFDVTHARGVIRASVDHYGTQGSLIEFVLDARRRRNADRMSPLVGEKGVGDIVEASSRLSIRRLGPLRYATPCTLTVSQPRSVPLNAPLPSCVMLPSAAGYPLAYLRGWRTAENSLPQRIIPDRHGRRPFSQIHTVEHCGRSVVILRISANS